MNNNDQQKKKEELIQREILDKNHDKADFINFCLAKKENGDDLNNWTLGELTIVVCQFLAKIKKESESKQETEKKEENDELRKENIENLEKFNVEELKN